MPSNIKPRPFRLPPEHEEALAAFVTKHGKSVHATLVMCVVDRITSKQVSPLIPVGVSPIKAAVRDHKPLTTKSVAVPREVRWKLAPERPKAV